MKRLSALGLRAALVSLVSSVSVLCAPAVAQSTIDDPLLRANAPDCRNGPSSRPERPCESRTQVMPARADTYRGLMLIVAGGGWQSEAPFSKATLDLSDVWLRAGWKTLTVEHTTAVEGHATRTGARALDDVKAWARIARRLLTAQRSSSVPLCIFGQSSSGHLALLTTPQDGVEIDCTVTEGAPTSLPDLAAGTLARARANAAFATDRLRRVYSPATYSDSYADREILMGHMRADRIVPLAQMTAFTATVPPITQVALAAGRDCRASEIDDTALHQRFAHLCQEHGGNPPRLLADGELARWRMEEIRLANRVGVGPL